MKIPPLVATGDYCLPISVPISVGAMFSFAQYEYSYDYLGSHSWTHTYLIFAGRGNWHFGFDIKGLDLYAGLSMGYRYYNYQYDGADKTWADNWYTSSYSGLYWGTQAGVHYYFTKNFGVGAEFGYPIFVRAGLAFKF